MLNQEEYVQENLHELKKKHKLYRKCDFNTLCMNEYISYVGQIEFNKGLQELRELYKSGRVPEIQTEMNFVLNKLKDKRHRDLVLEAINLLQKFNKIGKHEQEYIRD